MEVTTTVDVWRVMMAVGMMNLLMRRVMVRESVRRAGVDLLVHCHYCSLGGGIAIGMVLRGIVGEEVGVDLLGGGEVLVIDDGGGDGLQGGGNGREGGHKLGDWRGFDCAGRGGGGVVTDIRSGKGVVEGSGLGGLARDCRFDGGLLGGGFDGRVFSFLLHNFSAVVDVVVGLLHVLLDVRFTGRGVRAVAIVAFDTLCVLIVAVGPVPIAVLLG